MAVYAESLVQRHGMSNSKPVDTPLDVNVKLAKAASDSPRSSTSLQYQAAVGGVMYLMLGTRPDVAFAITALSQYN